MCSINSLEEEIKPEDCLEIIEKKRYRELMEDELSRLLEIQAKVKVKAKSLNMTTLKKQQKFWTLVFQYYTIPNDLR